MSSPSPLEQDTDNRLEELYPAGDALIGQLRRAGQARVFLISGPSGVGKDAVIEKMGSVYPDARYVVTSTTRARRDEERHGVHYNFLSREELTARIDAGEYIENSSVYGPEIYGVPRQPILDGLAAEQHIIIKVDVQGFRKLKDLIRPIVSIFIVPETMAALHARLRERKTETPRMLEDRFRTASEELKHAGRFDYVVFNEDGQLRRAVNDICGIIATEERRPNASRVWVSGA